MLEPPVSVGCPNPYYVSSYVQQVEFAPNSYNATLTDNASYAEAASIPQSVEMQMSPATGSCDVSPYRFSGTSVVNESTTSSSGTALGWGCGALGTGKAGLNGYWTMPTNGSLVSIDTQSNSTVYASFASVGAISTNSVRGHTRSSRRTWNQTVFAHFEVIPPEPVEVLSVTGPIAPFNPGGPVVDVDVKNTGGAPIVSLNASLSFVPPANLPANAFPPYSYSFLFGVNRSNPLVPRGKMQRRPKTLIGAGFGTGESYPLTISGMLADGAQFSYILDIQIGSP